MDEMKLLASPPLSAVPGLLHGFGQRLGGSRLSARERVQRRFAEHGEVFFLTQIHGGDVAQAPWTEPPHADAGFANEPGHVLAIETADCLPVLIVDPVTRRVAAAHAGWRGTLLQVARRAVKRLIETGSSGGNLLAALGPAIGSCCYEVGPKVEEAFGPAGSDFFLPGPGASRKNLDLVMANRAQLAEAGLPSTNIQSLDLCTRCRGDLFFSYRRDGASAGRMISIIGFSR